MHRRTVIAGFSTVFGLGLSGCLGALSDDEETQEVVEKYEQAYFHNTQAVEDLEDGLENYHSSDYGAAELRFDDAEGEFRTAEEELPEIEEVAELGSEDATDIIVEDTAVLSGAQVAAGHSALTAQSLQGDTAPLSKPPLENLEEDIRTGEFVIPDPETFESAF
ncbi:hypothetical protein ACLI4Z_16460 [Natrialbaceae archaeon A-arb3/5]